MKKGDRDRREETAGAFRGKALDATSEREKWEERARTGEVGGEISPSFRCTTFKKETPAQRGAGRAFEGVVADEDVYS